jgi:hypothetical protein
LSYLWGRERGAVVSTCMQGRPARALRSPPRRTLHHRACAGTHLPRSRAQSIRGHQSQSSYPSS